MRCLGVDLASRAWADVGFVTLEWNERWTDFEPRPVHGDGPLTSHAIADAIDRYARANGIAAVSIDGPHAWRDPARALPGVGRASEYEARTQGKTGAYGKTYPQTQHGWIAFSIAVFDALLAKPGVTLANDPRVPLRVPEGGYVVFECFPTQTWRSLGLKPLPGKARCSKEVVAAYARTLWDLLALPGSPPALSHDDLQAVMACLPAVAAFGGPLGSRAHGQPARPANAATGTPPPHLVEGLIWDVASQPRPTSGRLLVLTAEEDADEDEVTRECQLLADERTEIGEDALRRGIDLFEKLVAIANRGGVAEGYDYAFFPATVYGKPNFKEVMGRDFLNHVDRRFTLELARQITEAAGRRTVSRGIHSLEAGMDTFVWYQDAERPSGAFSGRWPPPYSEATWRAVFPDGQRLVYTKDGPKRHRAR